MQTEKRQLFVPVHLSPSSLPLRSPSTRVGIQIACAASWREPQRPAPRRTEHVVNINFAPCSDARVTVATAEAAAQQRRSGRRQLR